MSKHLDIVWTNQFKKDYKLAMKRHLDIEIHHITCQKPVGTIPLCHSHQESQKFAFRFLL